MRLLCYNLYCLKRYINNGDLTCVQIYTSIITVSVTRLRSPFRLELRVKLRTLLTDFTLVLESEAGDYGKGSYISDTACGVRPITMHCVS